MTKDTPNTTDEERAEKKLEDLRKALIEGEESGPGVPFDFEAFIASKRDRAPPR
jgi:antitoxin ParD1/3/4